MLRWIREGARCEWNELGAPAPFNKGVSLRPKDLEHGVAQYWQVPRESLSFSDIRFLSHRALQTRSI